MDGSETSGRQDKRMSPKTKAAHKPKASRRPKVSSRPSVANDLAAPGDALNAKLDAITLQLIACMHEHPMPRVDVYNVEFCPHCGESFTAVRESIQARFAAQGRTVEFPEHICLNCGLDHRRVTIAPET